VKVGRQRYDETILALQEPSLFVYRIDETTAPYAHALVERWTFEDDTRVSWTFAADPTWVLRVPGVRAVIGGTFKRAMRNLEALLS
jgi:hypothetical protein